MKTYMKKERAFFSRGIGSAGFRCGVTGGRIEEEMVALDELLFDKKLSLRLFAEAATAIVVDETGEFCGEHVPQPADLGGEFGKAQALRCPGPTGGSRSKFR